jgi:hypothetical protein
MKSHPPSPSPCPPHPFSPLPPAQGAPSRWSNRPAPSTHRSTEVPMEKQSNPMHVRTRRGREGDDDALLPGSLVVVKRPGTGLWPGPGVPNDDEPKMNELWLPPGTLLLVVGSLAETDGMRELPVFASSLQRFGWVNAERVDARVEAVLW